MSNLPGLQSRNRAFALLLRHVAVERCGGKSARLELLRELDGGLLGAGEDQHAIERLGLEDARQRIELVHAADQPVALADIGRGSWSCS